MTGFNQKEEQETLRRFERIIVQCIYSPLKENYEWTVRNNQETDKLLMHEFIVRLIKAQWLGHLQRMDDQCIPKKTGCKKSENEVILG